MLMLILRRSDEINLMDGRSFVLPLGDSGEFGRFGVCRDVPLPTGGVRDIGMSSHATKSHSNHQITRCFFFILFQMFGRNSKSIFMLSELRSFAPSAAAEVHCAF